MARKKKSNITKFRRRISTNLGLIVFLGAFIYMAISVYNFLSSDHVSEYEVSQGTIASNNTYRGMIIRDETVVFSDKEGYINYYIKNGSKASATDLICSVDTDGEISGKITAAASSSENLDQAELASITGDIESFSTGYDPMNFSSVYSFNGNLASELNQSLSSSALLSLSSSVAEAQSKNTFFPIYGDIPGVIAFYVDGMENVACDDFSASDLISAGYTRENLDEREQVQKADPLYKRINSEQWNIIIAINQETAERLNNRQYVDVRFVKDGYKTTASVSLIKKDGQFYVNLGLLRGMIRYLSDRYIEIELSLGDSSGLKIPVSSIVECELYKVPKSCFAIKDQPYVMHVQSGKEDREIAPNIYYETEDYYYIDNEIFSDGDTLQVYGSGEKYVIGTDKEKLTGVFNVNKGYAFFRYIKILNQSNEYAIVESKVPYSISMYDFIALDGSKLTINETIK